MYRVVQNCNEIEGLYVVFYSSMLMQCTNKDLLCYTKKLFTNNLTQVGLLYKELSYNLKWL